MSGLARTAGTVRLLPPDHEARLFLRLRTTVAWETVRAMLRTARLRLTLVVFLSGLFWIALYELFVEAFTFLEALHSGVIPLLLNAFFSSLTLMLLFSVGILLYGGLYRSPEARLLLTLPVRAEAIFAHKFREAMWFASWGFILLGSPMLVAYGVIRGAAWTYFALLPPLMLAFVAIPAAAGGLCCMALVAWLPRLRLHALSIAVTAACAAGIWLAWSILSRPRVDAVADGWLELAFTRLSITEQKLLPSWWLTSALGEAARTGREGRLSVAGLTEAGRFLALLVANALLLQSAAGWLARVAYRKGYSNLVGEVPARRRHRTSLLDRALLGGDGAVGRQLRILLVKDLRLFRRDVAQWSQFLIFFGLLGLYCLNLRSFDYLDAYASMIGFLNLAVVGLILSTFTTRFVYPMISLEGRRFWILGLLPLHRDQIVWSKFLFSFVGSLPPCAGLVMLGDLMLGLPWRLIALHEYCCLMLCLGLAGIAVGLGARMPNLRESSPAKIASGFGGTLCLVLSSLLILSIVVVAAVPTHVDFLARAFGPHLVAPHGPLTWVAGPRGAAVSLAIVTGIGLGATGWALAVGRLAFRRLEP